MVALKALRIILGPFQKLFLGYNPFFLPRRLFLSDHQVPSKVLFDLQVFSLSFLLCFTFQALDVNGSL